MFFKFKLQDGDLFEFKYSKHSDFIDNLEPEPGVIIEVIEPFTLKDFETAQIEYDKYIVFNEALEDIIKNKKIWSKEELKEFSKYDLDNIVLKWLLVKETKKDKEIKEKLTLDPFEIEYIDSDDIILYCLFDGTNQDKFQLSCSKGHLNVAQWFYSFGNVNININNDDAFICSCINGHLNVAQWLYSLGDVNIHTSEEICFKFACNGHLEVAQWLYSLGDVNIHIEDEFAFKMACIFGHLDVAQWLFSIGDVNIHINNDYVFIWACRNGHLEVAQWLYGLGDVDIHVWNGGSFVCACFSGHLEVARWLYSLGGFHKDGINTTHQPINDWLATLE